MKEYIILTVMISMLSFGFYSLIKERQEYYWHRKNWIDLKEQQFLIALEDKEWTSEMKDEQLKDWERYNEEDILWNS